MPGILIYSPACDYLAGMVQESARSRYRSRRWDLHVRRRRGGGSIPGLLPEVHPLRAAHRRLGHQGRSRLRAAGAENSAADDEQKQHYSLGDEE